MKSSGIAVLAVALGQLVHGAVGDASAGREFVESQQCLTCHSMNGEGGSRAPSLSRLGGRAYTPATMARKMWNHAPKMWTAIESSKIPMPKVTAQGAADLFAYFYMARFFEARGDAGRGRKLVEDKGCADCHGQAGPGPAVSRWTSVGDPIELARQMWNHAPKMNLAIQAKGGKTPQLTAAEMNDLAIYVGGAARPSQTGFEAASAETGETLFRVKGCTGCHSGTRAVPKPGIMMTTADLAASMWNHSAQMKPGSEMKPEEMRQIVGYLWSKQFEQEEGGSAQRGAQIWTAKGCQACHGAAPPASGERSSITLVAALWQHGPQMLKQMKDKGKEWPQFADSEMTDLLAYLKTK